MPLEKNDWTFTMDKGAKFSFKTIRNTHQVGLAYGLAKTFHSPRGAKVASKGK